MTQGCIPRSLRQAIAGGACAAAQVHEDEEGSRMPRIIVDDHFCKGCGLCVDSCPTHIIELDQARITAKGYHPATLIDEERCTGCMSCALMCPDVAITVER